MPTPQPHRRREPTQARSRERVERILSAAMKLVTEGGIAAATTRAIAAEADVPVATLYQFFPNREAVLHELIVRIMDQLDSELPRMFEDVHADTIESAVDQILVRHRGFYHAHPDLVVLYYAHAKELGVDIPGHRGLMVPPIHAVLIRNNLIRPDTAPLVTEIAIEIADRVFEIAYRRAPEGDPAIVAEGRLALIRYLEAYAPQR
ncbi:TetR/AcrR family transcriptional regulator [Nocardia sp. NPDC051030]|uniref:TetR/AcrR family transcriptional regulator n=1 Tax=Nocardia sp. NPDC051030 TaxID=3155162 RepID=UPI00343A4550